MDQISIKSTKGAGGAGEGRNYHPWKCSGADLIKARAGEEGELEKKGSWRERLGGGTDQGEVKTINRPKASELVLTTGNPET